MEDTKKNTLTDEELDTVVEEVSECDNGMMNNLKETVEVDPEAELEAGEAEVDPHTKQIDTIASEIDTDLAIDLFDAADDEKLEEAVEGQIVNNVKSKMDLDDDDAYEFINIIREFKASGGRVPNLFDRLPEKIQEMIKGLMRESNIPGKHIDQVTAMVMSEFVNNAEVDAAFVDLEKTLAETLKIPSLVDMYGEHTNTLMEKNIPEMIEKIKDEEPEKAEMLQKVKDGYTASRTLSRVKEFYLSNNSAKKMVRRADNEFRHCIDSINRKNANTRFKMYDAYEMIAALAKVLCADPVLEYSKCKNLDIDIPEDVIKLIDLKASETDIKKLVTLICFSCESLNATDVIDASYMYYLTKNVIMLKHTQDAKTDFAAELINNICDLIALIRDEEAKFYAENQHLVKSKLSKKSRSTRGGKK